jgi:hypothetical protein
MFTERDKVKLKAIKIEKLDEIDLVDKNKIKQVIDDINSGKGYEPVKVFHNLDNDTYILKEGLETYMACWKLEYEWIDVEISY